MEAAAYIRLSVSPSMQQNRPVLQESLCREDALAVGETDLTQTGELMRFTISANMAGIPAISVPVGHCSKGVPSAAVSGLLYLCNENQPKIRLA